MPKENTLETKLDFFVGKALEASYQRGAQKFSRTYREMVYEIENILQNPEQLSSSARLHAVNLLAQDSIQESKSFKYKRVVALLQTLNQTPAYFHAFTEKEASTMLGIELGVARCSLSSQSEQNDVIELLTSIQNSKYLPQHKVAVTHTMLDIFPLFTDARKQQNLFDEQWRLITQCVEDQTIDIKDVHDLTYRFARQKNVNDDDTVPYTVNNRVNHIAAYANSRYRENDTIFTHTWLNGMKDYPDESNWKNAFIQAYQHTYRPGE